jgi:WD40 repeat protein
MSSLPRLCVSALAILLAGGAAPSQSPSELKGHDALVYSLAFSPDGKLLATAGFDNVVILWDFAAGKEARKLTGHTGAVYCVAFSKDGKLLASSSLDKTIRLWNVADGKFLREIKGHTGIVDSVAFSPDGKQLASCSEDKSVRLWNPADGKEIKNLGAHANPVYSIAYSHRLQPRRQTAGLRRRRQDHQDLGRGWAKGSQATEGPYRGGYRSHLHSG